MNLKTETITIDDIRKLIKKNLGLSITRATIYNYIKTKSFPKNMGMGRPRIWRLSDVESWLKNQQEG